MAWCQQAITGANVDPDLCRHVASLAHSKLNQFIVCLTSAAAESLEKCKTEQTILTDFMFLWYVNISKFHSS